MKIHWVIIILAVTAGLCMVTLAVVGMLMAIAVPGFLRARKISMRNACQKNQSRIDAAIQQYILSHRLSGIGPDNGQGFLDHVVNPVQDASNQQTWLTAHGSAPGEAVIIGPTSRLRFAPICPAGGFYHLQDPDNPTAVSPHSVYCTLRHRETMPAYFHVFPGEDPTTVSPLPQ